MPPLKKALPPLRWAMMSGQPLTNNTLVVTTTVTYTYMSPRPLPTSYTNSWSFMHEEAGTRYSPPDFSEIPICPLSRELLEKSLYMYIGMAHKDTPMNAYMYNVQTLTIGTPTHTVWLIFFCDIHRCYTTEEMNM